MEIVKLHFTSPLHLSKGKSVLDESFEVLHSDTLKSALFVCALELGLVTGDDAKSFLESFTLSSAFPYVGKELFFPKPEWMKESLTKALSEDDKKKFKKIRFISQTTFEQILDGSLERLNGNCFTNIKYYTQNNISENQPFKSETVQRVVVSRTYDEEGSNTFYTERLYFSEGCGLYFIIDVPEEKRTIIQAALLLLGDNGIGSDKTVGNGQFEFKGFESVDFKQAEGATHQMAMSLYCPTKEEIVDEVFLNDSAYSLIKRGGYIANPDNFNNSTLRKKSIVMFNEGSVFPSSKKLVGKVADLKPDIPIVKHSIWRDGRALFLPYNLKS
jgi:CRISPR-associated protein Csm4